MMDDAYRVARERLRADLRSHEVVAETVLGRDDPDDAAYVYCTRIIRVPRSEAPAQAATYARLAAEVDGYLTIAHHRGVAILTIGVAGPLSAREEAP